MMRRQQGFTLIELMIALAIIGILVSIALSTYQDYTVRAQVSEALVFADQSKSAIVEYYHAYGVYPTNRQQAGLETFSGSYVSAIDVNQGKIEITLGRAINQLVAGDIIILSPSTLAGVITWRCSSSTADRYLPSSCR